MTTRETPIRVGLIGYGFAGKTFHAPLIGGVPALTLAAVASGDAAKVHADLPGVAVVADPGVLIADDGIDLIVIASPNDSHAPLSRAALLAGKAVVVDKPFTLDLAEARALATLAGARGRLLSIFHNRRWDSDFLSVRRAIAGGLIGDVAHFESHFDRFRPAVRDRWREGDGPGSGLWYDLGPHLVDQALCLFGPPDAVQASLACQRSGGRSTDWAHVLLLYGERRVILHGSMLVAGGVPRFTVHGTAGSLVKRQMDRQEAQLLAGTRPGDAGWGEDDDPLLHYDASGAEHAIPATPGDQSLYYAAIADALHGHAANPVPPEQAVTVMAIIDAAIESARTGRTVPLILSDAERGAWR